MLLLKFAITVYLTSALHESTWNVIVISPILVTRGKMQNTQTAFTSPFKNSGGNGKKERQMQSFLHYRKRHMR